MSDTLTRRDVAQAARAYAVQSGVTEGHGSRGRVSHSVVLAYLQANPAKTVREIAEGLGVEITPTGKIRDTEFEALANFVTKNAPKAEPAE
jgi:transcription initiation factor TFIIIB Brf1 subunit/transcription initiation factor TFIIB